MQRLTPQPCAEDQAHYEQNDRTTVNGQRSTVNGMAMQFSRQGKAFR